ncbi:hypothetical protein D917_05226 [Trichinella nativa]|uniref:Uncharacterized protein n=1 Tax=Trichinella nativa TaxID=6335 RepID=A0A1Y3EXB4_9BILA|nr:hypothetical protein D917_05226 [Trichinella nativa]
MAVLSKFCKEDDNDNVQDLLTPFFRTLAIDNSVLLSSSNYSHESLPKIKNFQNIKDWMNEVEKYFKSENIPSEMQRVLLWNALPIHIKDILIVFDISSETEITKFMTFLKETFRINADGDLQLLLCDIEQGEKESMYAYAGRIKTFMKFNFRRTNWKLKESLSTLQFLNGMYDLRIREAVQQFWRTTSFMTLVRLANRLSKSEEFKKFERPGTSVKTVREKASKKDNANVKQ